MGIEEAVRILLNMVKEYCDRFSDEAREHIFNIGTECIRLSMISRTPEEKDAYKSIKNALAQVANKIEIATINEAESYQNIGKVIKILTA
jgi:hypothetical protein